VDRLLDMCRTVTNVTGDCAVATVVAHSEGQLGTPDLDESEDRIRLVAEG
jgi:Na+/H+-dicarboxylate symporter